MEVGIRNHLVVVVVVGGGVVVVDNRSVAENSNGR